MHFIKKITLLFLILFGSTLWLQNCAVNLPEDHNIPNTLLALILKSGNATSAPATSLSDLSYLQVLDPTHSSLVKAYMQNQASLGNSAAATITISGAAYNGGAGINRWQGGVLAPNGYIYAIPRRAAQVLKIDPNTDTAVLIGTNYDNTIDKWMGGALAPNGKIYGIPFQNYPGDPAGTSRILVIDPATDTTSEIIVSRGACTNYCWNGGALAYNGKIYAVPFDASSQQILEINPVSNTTALLGTGLNPGGTNWCGAIPGMDGMIYFQSHRGNSMLKIDPLLLTSTSLTVSGVGTTTEKWIGAVMSPQGKLYGIPYVATTTEGLTITDPAIGNVVRLNHTGVAAGQFWLSGALAPNGIIFSIPAREVTALVIDTSNNSVIQVSGTPGLGVAADKWAGGILAPNGKIYGMPSGSDRLLIISPNSNGSYPNNILLSGYLNKY